jgi:hypothetical protein
MLTDKRTPVDGKLLGKMMLARPNVPDGRCGKVKITSKVVDAGKPLPCVSARNMIFMGEQRTTIHFDAPVTIRELSYENGVWMSDIPQEVWQMRHAVKNAHDRVLVGGLGLGVITTLIACLSENVAEVVTVEKDKRIVTLVAEHLPVDIMPYSPVLTRDLFEFIGGLQDDSFDYAFLDIWQGTGESEWKDYIVPLRRLCRNKIAEVDCWNEEEMIGQLRMGLPRHALLDQEIGEGHFGFYQDVFRLACRKAGVKPTFTRDTPLNDMVPQWEASYKNPKIIRLLEDYLRPGTDKWERTFGALWDEHSARYESARAARRAAEKVVRSNAKRPRKSR